MSPMPETVRQRLLEAFRRFEQVNEEFLSALDHR
jgi:hypothetical protein